jgi:hypothetical protein
MPSVTPEPQSPIRRAILWLLIAVPPALVLVAVLAPGWATSSPKDFDSYLIGARAILAGRSPYTAAQVAGPFDLQDMAGTGYVYPPSAAIITAPFLISRELFAVLNYLALVTGCLVVLRHYRLLRPASAFVTLWAITFHPGTMESLSLGAVSPAVAGALGLAVTRAPAWPYGVGAALKLFPGAWVAVGARRRPPRDWIWFLAGALVPALIAIVFAGLDPWLQYVRVLVNAEASCNSIASLPCAGVPPMLLYGLAAVLLLAAAVAPVAIGMLATVTAVLIVAPDIWYHYLLLFVPAVLALIGSGVQWWRDQARATPGSVGSLG